MKFNIQQQEAINTLGSNTLVCASAGAGKTAVLVERLAKRCIIDKISLDKIVAMTFTEAAASEMKQRLAARIKLELTSTNSDKQYINSQLALLEAAQISTIHSFCLMLIKKHCDIINLDPKIANNILSDGTLNKAKDKVFSEAFKQFSTDEFNNLSALCTYFSESAMPYERIKESVFKIINFATSIDDYEKWYQNAIMISLPISKEEDISQEVKTLFKESLIQKLNHNLAVLKKMQDSDLDKKESIIVCIKFYEDAIKKASKDNFNEFICAYNLLKDKKLASKNKKYPIYSSLKDQVLKLDYLMEVNDLIKLHNISSEVAVTFLKLALLTHKLYQKEKMRLEGMDFSDMEVFAQRILCANNHAVSKFYKGFYQEILVDEFQDTNDVQNEIVNAISNGYNCFRVGDVKQSIYGFRYAKPDLMRGLIEDDSVKKIFFSYNYRSNKAIVEFNNILFNKAMNINDFKDKFLDEDIVECGSDNQKETLNPVKFIGLHLPDHNSDELKKAKAKQIASTILKMMSDTQFKKYSDYVILTNSHKEKIILKNVFKQYGIPFSIEAKEGFYQSDCILTITSFLKLILNNFDEISLVSTLTSAIYKMSNNEIARYKLEYNSILDGCISNNHPIINDLNNLKYILENKNLSDLLSYISKINDYYYYHLSIKQKTNYDLLYQKVCDFENTSNSLLDLIEEIEINKEERSDEAISVSQSENVVSAITIHHSKGLAFNVVFYFTKSKSSNIDMETKEKILCDPTIGIGLDHIILPERYAIKSLNRKMITYKHEKEQFEEDIRVLYVALTRPKHHLIIVDAQAESYELSSDLSYQYFKSRQSSGLFILNFIKNVGLAHLTIKEASSNQYFDVEILHDVSEVEKIQSKTKEFTKLSKYQILKQDAINKDISPSKLSHQAENALTLNSNEGLEYGTYIHNVIEKLPNKLWDDKDFEKFNLRDSDKEKLLNFSNSSIYKKCLNMKITKEADFHYLNNNNINSGIIDFLATDDNEVIIIDFKSDHLESIDSFIKQYETQLLSYKDALAKIYPSHKISCYIYSLYLSKDILVI
ncbi:MAG: UvrD-helicase domain-containing protein [Anaerorhabdus sp.]